MKTYWREQKHMPAAIIQVIENDGAKPWGAAHPHSDIYVGQGRIFVHPSEYSIDGYELSETDLLCLLAMIRIAKRTALTAGTARVRKALIYVCNEHGIPSRNNEVEVRPRATWEGSHQMIMQAFNEFIHSRERCKLVLELDDGREISFLPVLRPDSPAFDEAGYTGNAAFWDMTVEVWPK